MSERLALVLGRTPEPSTSSLISWHLLRDFDQQSQCCYLLLLRLQPVRAEPNSGELLADTGN